MKPDLEDDAIVACADVVGHSGAVTFKIGYLHDGVPAEQAGWYAYAQYRGKRLSAENQPGPVEAAEALGRRVLSGGQCQHCRARVTVSDDDETPAFDGHLLDGTKWDIETAAAAGVCRWRRMGKKWVRGCGPDGLAASIEHALNELDMEPVASLLVRLADQDPDRARELHESILQRQLDGRLALSRPQRRLLERLLRRP